MKIKQLQKERPEYGVANYPQSAVYGIIGHVESLRRSELVSGHWYVSLSFREKFHREFGLWRISNTYTLILIE